MPTATAGSMKLFGVIVLLAHGSQVVIRVSACDVLAGCPVVNCALCIWLVVAIDAVDRACKVLILLIYLTMPV
jgi:hypothetical protein